MTAKQQARAPITGDDNPPVPVTMVEGVVKTLIRDHIADPVLRHLMWSAFASRLEDARRSSAFSMPWEQPNEVQEIAAAEVVSVLAAMLNSVRDAIHAGTLATSLADWRLMRDQVAALAQPIEDYCNGTPSGPKARTCACGCGTVWVPKGKTGRYYANHRQRAYRRKRDSKPARSPAAP
ncbi:MAG: hypothetical protein JO345_34535 [Streptosporangiaceae bacterium]|nr:hypothetical protein [Streptosporangiaceae bacterium]